MARIYGIVATNNEMKALEEKALETGSHAVGVTNRGGLYKWDAGTSRAIDISKDDAAKLLDVTLDDIDKIIESKCTYVIAEHVIDEPVVELIETTEEIDEDINEDVDEPEIIEDVKQEEPEVTAQDEILRVVKDINAKIDSIKDDIRVLKDLGIEINNKLL